MSPTRVALGRGFARLWAVAATANLADGILLVAFPLLALELTRSPLRISLVSAAATLPWLLVALHAGVLADRRDRRRIMLAAMGLRVVVLVALAAAAIAEVVTLPLLYATVLVLGVAEVLADTTTQSLLPMLVPRARLGAANGRVVATQTVANDFLGGPVAGVLVGVGLVAAVAVPAGLYALAALLLLTLRGTYRPPARGGRTVGEDLVEGVRYLTGHRVLRSLGLLAGLCNLAGAAYLAVFVLWAVGAESAVGLTPQQYGTMMAALAGGGIAGALVTERLVHRVGDPALLRWATAALGPLFLLPVVLPSPAVVAGGFVAIGFAVAVTKVVVVSLAQRLIPEQLLGRVNATYRLVGLGTMPLGALLGGALGSGLGLVPALATAAGICLLALGVATRGITPATVRAADARA